MTMTLIIQIPMSKGTSLSTDLSSQPSYISPWKNVDTTRQLQHKLNKQRLLQQIFLPSHLRNKKQLSLPHSPFSSPLQTPHTQQTTLNLKNLLNKKVTEDTYHPRRQCKTFVSKKSKQEQQLFDKLIFIKRQNSSGKTRVVSVGSQSCEEKISMNKLNETKTTFKTEASYLSPKDEMFDFKQSPQISEKKLQYQKRVAYKKISQTLMTKLENCQNKKGSQTQLLSKTLQNFMLQQRRV